MPILSRLSGTKENGPTKQEARLGYSIELDRRSAAYVGPDDPITGKVAVRCLHLQGFAGELFGPLKIMITFSGRTKTKAVQKCGDSETTRRARADLFSLCEMVYDGPFTTEVLQTYKFPFSITFPRTPMRTATTEKIPVRCQHPEGQQLPPSMLAEQPKKRCFVEYKLSATVLMMNMPSVVVLRNQFPTSIYYRRKHLGAEPVLSSQRTETNVSSVSNAMLLPEEGRPQTFKQKTKAFFKSDAYPTFRFETTTTCPTAIHVGTPLEFTINIKPCDLINTEGHAATIRPCIELMRLVVEIKASIAIRCEGSWVGSTHGWTLLKPEYTIAKGLGKVLAVFDDERGWKHIVKASPLPPSMMPDFDTYNISVRHTISVRWELRCAGKEFHIGAGTFNAVKRNLTIEPALVSPATDEPQPPLFENAVAEEQTMEECVATAKAMEGDISESDDEEQLPSYEAAASSSRAPLQATAGQTQGNEKQTDTHE
ncbi:MAG: hypothetical protein Q9159_002466 [Coniocarpon cinnabarinum]